MKHWKESPEIFVCVVRLAESGSRAGDWDGGAYLVGGLLAVHASKRSRSPRQKEGASHGG